jgi:hypothetical protein
MDGQQVKKTGHATGFPWQSNTPGASRIGLTLLAKAG